MKVFDFKLRIWDRKRKVLAFVKSLDFSAGSLAGMPWFSAGFSDHAGGFSGVFTTQFVVEQWTGLKDESGKDIFAGDVVRVTDNDGFDGYIDNVTWGIVDNYPAFDLKRHAGDYDSNALSDIMNAGQEIIEVIGNIHEDPELLEVEK